MPDEQAAHAHAGPWARLSLGLMTLITLGFCAWVLSLPIFPSHDGPMHLFYTAILHDLLFAHGQHFGQFYNVKHVLPPYSLYYYLLMFLARFGSLVTANKIVICLYMVSFSFGFRYLARTVGPNADSMALLATPMMFSWPLVMGFVNFCLSTTLMFWAMGLWSRSAMQESRARRMVFLVLAYTIMLTHPVPLLFLLAFCGLELLLRWLRERRLRSAEARRFASGHVFRDALYLLAASGTLVYVKLFTIRAALSQQEEQTGLSFTQVVQGNIKNYLTLHTVLAFASSAMPFLILRALWRAALLGALLLAVVYLWRKHVGRAAQPGSLRMRWSFAELWTVIAVLFALALPFIPRDLNGSHLFAARLGIFVWLAALLAASGSPLLARFVRPAAAGMALTMAGLTLFLAQSTITPIAREIGGTAAQETAHIQMAGHHVGLMLYTLDRLEPQNLAFDPFRWAGADVFRDNDKVLYNSPWLNLAIIPIGPQPTLPNGSISARVLEEQGAMRTLLGSSAETRASVLRAVDFAVLVNGTSPMPAGLDPLLAEDPDQLHPWRCTGYGWYSFCERLSR